MPPCPCCDKQLRSLDTQTNTALAAAIRCWKIKEEQRRLLSRYERGPVMQQLHQQQGSHHQEKFRQTQNRSHINTPTIEKSHNEVARLLLQEQYTQVNKQSYAYPSGEAQQTSQASDRKKVSYRNVMVPIIDMNPTLVTEEEPCSSSLGMEGTFRHQRTIVGVGDYVLCCAAFSLDRNRQYSSSSYSSCKSKNSFIAAGSMSGLIKIFGATV